MSDLYVFLTIMIVAALTLAIRVLPFAVFSGERKPPAFITWLGGQLPRAVMVMLVVYCLKDLSFGAAASWLPAIAGVASAAALHIWKKQTLLSVGGATLVYMLLLRAV